MFSSRPRTPTQRIGAAGEEAAAAELQAAGYHILDRNYRCPYGEVDLVARDGEDLREVVYELVAPRGWKLRELTRGKHTLEEIFVKMTRDKEEEHF